MNRESMKPLILIITKIWGCTTLEPIINQQGCLTQPLLNGPIFWGVPWWPKNHLVTISDMPKFDTFKKCHSIHINNNDTELHLSLPRATVLYGDGSKPILPCTI